MRQAIDIARSEAVSPAEFRSVLDQLLDPVMQFNRSGEISFYNRSAQQILGLPESVPVAPIRLSSVVEPTSYDFLLNLGLPAAIQNGSWKGELYLLQHGRTVLTGITLLAHRDSGKIKRFSLFWPAANEQAKKLPEMTTSEGSPELEALASMGNAFGVIAHDLNNVFGSLTMSLPLLVSDEMKQEIREVLLGAMESTRLGAGLVKIAQAYCLNLQGAAGSALLSQFVNGAIVQSRKPVRVTPADLGQFGAVAGDSAKLQTAMRLLLDQAATLGTGTLTLLVTSEAVQKRPGVRIEIRTEAGEIDPAYIERLTKPVFSSKQGRGVPNIEWATILGIVAGHGGRVFANYSSASWNGSFLLSFGMILPMKPLPGSQAKGDQ
ncbi:MAG: PAS domain-containing protein [Verrucomicrobiota bacterium]|nr:PAS domain-containing protein [Verrucomicrobiota bacterium]